MRSFLGLKENYIFQGSFYECVLQSVENQNVYSQLKNASLNQTQIHFFRLKIGFTERYLSKLARGKFHNFHTVCQSVGTNTAVSSFLIELK